MTQTGEELVGQTLPNVTLESSKGGTVSFPKDAAGKWTLIYFYPKDDTPGCTRQACSYRDNLKRFEDAHVQIFGVSGDDLKSHEKFINKFSLNFPLLADVNSELSKALGAKQLVGLSRDTVLVDPKGVIRHVWRKVSPDKTMEETLAAAQELMRG